MADGSSKKAGAGGMCKIKPDPSGEFDFQIRAADMPVKIKLCEDHAGNLAVTASFNTIKVFVAASNPPQSVEGQPSAMSATNATLSLSPGSYNVVIVVNRLPNADVVYVFEDCNGLNQLESIATPIDVTGHFSLRVVE